MDMQFTKAKYEKYRHCLNDSKVSDKLKVCYLKRLRAYASMQLSQESFILHKGHWILAELLKNSKNTQTKLRSISVKIILTVIFQLSSTSQFEILKIMMDLTRVWKGDNNLVVIVMFFRAFSRKLKKVDFFVDKLKECLKFCVHVCNASTSLTNLAKQAFCTMSVMLKFSKLAFFFIKNVNLDVFLSKNDWMKLKSMNLIMHLLVKYFYQRSLRNPVPRVEYGSNVVDPYTFWDNLITTGTLSTLYNDFVKSSDLNIVSTCSSLLVTMGLKRVFHETIQFSAKIFTNTDFPVCPYKIPTFSRNMESVEDLRLNCLRVILLVSVNPSTVQDEPDLYEICLTSLFMAHEGQILDSSSLIKCLYVFHMFWPYPPATVFSSTCYFDTLLEILRSLLEFPEDVVLVLIEHLVRRGTLPACRKDTCSCFCSVAVRFNHQKIHVILSIFKIFERFIKFYPSLVPRGCYTLVLDFVLCSSARGNVSLILENTKSFKQFAPTCHLYNKILEKNSIYVRSLRTLSPLNVQAVPCSDSLWEYLTFMRWKLRRVATLPVITWKSYSNNECRKGAKVVDQVMLHAGEERFACSYCDLINMSDYFSGMFNSGMTECDARSCKLDEEVGVVETLVHLSGGCRFPDCFMRGSRGIDFYFDLFVAADKFGLSEELVNGLGMLVMSTFQEDVECLVSLVGRSLSCGRFMEIVCSFILSTDVYVAYSFEYFMRNKSFQNEFFIFCKRFCEGFCN